MYETSEINAIFVKTKVLQSAMRLPYAPPPLNLLGIPARAIWYCCVQTHWGKDNLREYAPLDDSDEQPSRAGSMTDKSRPGRRQDAQVTRKLKRDETPRLARMAAVESSSATEEASRKRSEETKKVAVKYVWGHLADTDEDSRWRRTQSRRMVTLEKKVDQILDACTNSKSKVKVG